MRTIVPLVLLVCGLLCATTLAADIESDARKLEGLLMAPCCGANTLALHESGPAQEMKAEIREFLAAGKTRQEILDHYVAQRGVTILAVPPSQGFNLLIYVLPALLLVCGPIVLWRALRKRVPREMPADASSAVPSSPPTIDAAYRERLERQIEQY